MHSNEFIELIRYPERIKKGHLSRLNNLCQKHSYCSSLHKLRLIALKENESETYNQELKMTAAISGNRTLLFEYIVKNSFHKKNEKHVGKTKKEPLKTLELRKPLEFYKSEKHSFNEWLKLTEINPIKRNLKPLEKTTKINGIIGGPPCQAYSIAGRNKEDDFIDSLVISMRHEDLLCFTNIGRVYKLPVRHLPLAGRSAKGRPANNYLPLTCCTICRPLLWQSDTSNLDY